MRKVARAVPAAALFAGFCGAGRADPYSAFSFCAPPRPPACAAPAASAAPVKDCPKQVEVYVAAVFKYRLCLTAEMERAVRQTNETIHALRCAQDKRYCRGGKLEGAAPPLVGSSAPPPGEPGAGPDPDLPPPPESWPAPGRRKAGRPPEGAKAAPANARKPPAAEKTGAGKGGAKKDAAPKRAAPRGEPAPGAQPPSDP